ncbi:uncharacterized protein HMPREF1541_00033 [Cyphellophora europaea CBS 101466]|uniref:Protein kinase domain-containing protein n=1 Tax=Cyphellophora europaea (strain CBS 101466) TaxID=1220924 RepID=W2SAX3_CYPE1|nr:uncharacterized protein HMPREF1541_00033 [Cyphellophora europaea CBS 101466]ETN45852.1 hypothetical protein HMPREF1541_00033 [Cyphellophora europaea CBS 101466]
MTQEHGQANHFRNVARALEHIIQYVDFFRDPGLIVVMEYAPRSLGQCEIMSDRECVTLLLHVLSGLAYLHGAAILHRDVTPDNILQTSINPPFWKLSDFGFSKKLKTGAVGTSTFCGSPLYVAPEVDGLPHSLYTEAVDLWSLGIVGVEYSVGFGNAIREKVPRKWHTAVRGRAKRSKLDPYLLEMLQTSPEKRPSASAISLKLKDRECYEENRAPTSSAMVRQASGTDLAEPSTLATSEDQPRNH